VKEGRIGGRSVEERLDLLEGIEGKKLDSEVCVNFE
jgi:hypothetical protein